MKCPHCNKDIRESLVLSEAARINGRRQGRRDGGGKRCPIHGTFLGRDGTCKRCRRENQNAPPDSVVK